MKTAFSPDESGLKGPKSPAHKAKATKWTQTLGSDTPWIFGLKDQVTFAHLGDHDENHHRDETESKLFLEEDAATSPTLASFQRTYVGYGRLQNLYSEGVAAVWKLFRVKVPWKSLETLPATLSSLNPLHQSNGTVFYLK